MRKRWLFTENDEVFVLGQRSSLRITDSWKGRRHVLSLVILPMVIFMMVLMVLVVLVVLMVLMVMTADCDDGANDDIHHHHRHHNCGQNFVTLYSF